MNESSATNDSVTARVADFVPHPHTDRRIGYITKALWRSFIDRRARKTGMLREKLPTVSQ